MSRTPSTIGLIGTFTLDELRPYRGRIRRGFGGLYWSLLVLASLARSGDRIIPVARLGQDLGVRLRRALRRLGTVQVDCLTDHEGRDNRVRSWHPTPTDREEISLDIPRPLGAREVSRLPACDVMYVNCASGRDLTLRAMGHLRSRPGALIYLDYHSLALGVRKSGHRYPLYRRNWASWTGLADIVQMNQAEASLLYRRPVDSAASARRFGAEVFAAGSEILIITRSGDGAWLLERGRRTPVAVPVSRVARRGDVVGAGDGFGAGFVSAFVRSGDAAAAVRAGHAAAQQVIGVSSSAELASLAASHGFKRR